MSNSSSVSIQSALQAHARGELNVCQDICEQLIARDPDDPDALHILGLVLHAKKQYPQAQTQIERALSLNPQSAVYQANLATVLNDSGNLMQAQQHYERALQINDDNAQAHNGLGIIARKQRDYNLAIEHYRRAIDLDPDFSVAHSNLANALNLSGKFAQGLEHAKAALRINDRAAEAWNNLGFAENMLGEPEMAERAFEQAITLAPNLAVARFNIAAMQLRDGNYAHGWQNYDWRLRLNDVNVNFDPTNVRYPQIDEVKGTRITLLAEQGMGDFLQFLRFAKTLHEAGAELTVTCDKRLISLVSQLHWIKKIFPRGTKIDKSDHVIPIMSLARMLKIDFDNVPTPIPYIRVPAEVAERWQTKMLTNDGKILVGLTWFGNPENPVNNLRSIPFKHFYQLEAVRNARFISLQTGTAVADLRTSGISLNLLDLGILDEQEKLSFSFDDTAAILLNLDLFITSCTVTAHLAGALGVPTWLLVSKVADWRWGQVERVSRWYPSIRIFRQPEHGDWESVLATVAKELETVAQNVN